MSDLVPMVIPTIIDQGWKYIPFAVLVASLTGSAHCVSMCGGLIVAVSRSRMETWMYHLGRLLGYLVVGAFAGGLGEKLLNSTTEGILSWTAALTVGISLILIGLRTWSGNSPHFFKLPSPALQFLFKHAGKNAFLTGSFTALLPCGWLQNFVLAAVATRNASSGALLLFFFWLGTLPALTFTPFLVEKLLRPLGQKLPRLSAVLLISAGFLSIGLKTSPIFFQKSPQPKSCHKTSDTLPHHHH